MTAQTRISKLTAGSAGVEADADSISLELADDLIRQVFAVSLNLASCMRLASEVSAERISRSLDGLDRIIQVLRQAALGAENWRPSTRDSSPSEPEDLVDQLDFLADRITHVARADAADAESSRYLLDAVRSVRRARLSLGLSR